VKNLIKLIKWELFIESLFLVALALAVWTLHSGRTDVASLENGESAEQSTINNLVSKEAAGAGLNEPAVVKELSIDQHCFLKEFSSQVFPWDKSDCLNIEEVFKNYQYYETMYLEKERLLVVKKVVFGQLQMTMHYQITDENQLQEKK
jgi:hypothetical protein